MNDVDDIRLNLFLFSVGGVHFGVDAGQVAGVHAYDGEHGEDLFRLHEELGFGNKELTYLSPVIITIRQRDKQPYRVIIDSIEDVAEFSHADIKPFPTLLEPFFMRKGIWGILSRHGIMLLLLDFKLLLKGKRSNKA